MSFTSVLERIKNALHPSVTQNTLLDALLGAPSDEIAVAEGKIEAWSYGAGDIEAGTAAVTQGTSVVTVTGGLDLTTRYQVDDDFVLAGSFEGNSGRYRVTAVTSTTVTVNHVFAATEAFLSYGRTKPQLIRLAKGMALFPGGFESDKTIREQILGRVGVIHRYRGSTQGVTEDLGRLSGMTPQVLDSVKGVTLLGTGKTIAAGGASLAAAVSAGTLKVGDDFTLALSTTGSNGRYFVYTNDGTTIVPARRAVASLSYYSFYGSNIEVHIREDRANKRLYFRVVNPTAGNSKQINLSFQATSAVQSVGVAAGVSYAVTLSAGVASIAWQLAAGEIREGWLTLATTATTEEITVSLTETLTGTSLSTVRWGSAGLFPRHQRGVLDVSTPAKVKWGGLIKTTFRGGIGESGLTLYADAIPGYYLDFGYPGVYENDAYTVSSPDEFVVIEVDHRNQANYSESDIKQLARDYILPADSEYVLGFV